MKNVLQASLLLPSIVDRPLGGLFHCIHWVTPRLTAAVWLIALAAAWLVKSKAARWAWLFVMFSGLPVLFIETRDNYAYYIPLFGWALLAASLLGAAAKPLTRSLPGPLEPNPGAPGVPRSSESGL